MNKVAWSKPIEWFLHNGSTEKAEFVGKGEAGTFRVKTKYGPLYCDEYGTYGVGVSGYIRNIQDRSEPEIPQYIYQRVGEVEMFKSGATIRDQFAMAALQGLLSESNYNCEPSVYVNAAYEYADFMIEARKKGN